MPFERYFAVPHKRSKQHHARRFDDLDSAREYLRKHGGGTIQERNAKVIYSSRLGLSKVVFDPPLRTWGDIEVIGVDGEDREESKKQQFGMFSDMQPAISSVDTSVYPVDSITLDRKTLGYWITGFTDGEGSFYYSPPQKTGQRQLKFKINLREDDLAVLELIQAYWGGIGRIYGEPSRDRASGYKSRPIKDFEVYDCQELLVVVKHFEEFPLLSKKAESFQDWKQRVYRASEHGKYWRREVGMQIDALGEQLSSLQGYPGKRRG